MKIFGSLKVKGKLCFQTKHVSDVDNSLDNRITRCEPSCINAELKYQRLGVNWREQVMGGKKGKRYSMI